MNEVRLWRVVQLHLLSKCLWVCPHWKSLQSASHCLTNIVLSACYNLYTSTLSDSLSEKTFMVFHSTAYMEKDNDSCVKNWEVLGEKFIIILKVYQMRKLLWFIKCRIYRRGEVVFKELRYSCHEVTYQHLDTTNELTMSSWSMACASEHRNIHESITQLIEFHTRSWPDRKEEQSEKKASDYQSLGRISVKAGWAKGPCSSVTNPASLPATYPRWQMPGKKPAVMLLNNTSICRSTLTFTFAMEPICNIQI